MCHRFIHQNIGTQRITSRITSILTSRFLYNLQSMSQKLSASQSISGTVSDLAFQPGAATTTDGFIGSLGITLSSHTCGAEDGDDYDV